MREIAGMRKMGWLVAAGGAVLLGGAERCGAWNGTGHEVVALVAWNGLTPGARARVTALLRAHPQYEAVLAREGVDGEKKERDAFLIAATWPDLVRSGTNRGAMYSHPAWHYINYPYVVGELPEGVQRPEEPVVRWAPGTEPANAVQAYAKCVGELGDGTLSDGDRAVALAWVEHLVGDIHQPLHAAALFSGTFPKGDQGGNLMMVQGKGGVMNLHALWDGMLGSYQTDAEIEQIAKRVSELHPRSEFGDELKIEEFEDWAKASFAQAKADAYEAGRIVFLTREEQGKDKTRAVPELPAGYMERAKADVERDVALAGYRLAAVINKVMGEAAEKK